MNQAKRLAPLVVLALLASLAACGTSQPDARVVQPCDAVDAAAVAKVLGHGVTKNTGTPDAPTCVITSTVKGGAYFTLNYQWWFKGGLDKAWKTMSDSIGGKVTDVDVPGADAAKLVVNTQKKVAYASGFVEDGNLVQLVNGTALPKDAAALRRATLLLMAQISKGAPSSPSAAASA